MKLLLLISLFFVFSSTLISQVVNFPDPNFKLKLLQSSPSNTIAKDLGGNYFAIDANGDSEIQVTEAQQVSELKISSYTPNLIHSFSGIESFTNLVKLNCANNSALDSLYISGFQHLTQVVVAPNSNLTKINASFNPLLSDLSLYATGFFTPDLTDLDTLICTNNALTSLYIAPTNDPLALRYLDCSNNQINSIDYGSVRYLYHLNMSHNQIRHIESSNFMNLTFLKFDHNPLLTYDVRYSKIASLEFSNFDSLTVINANTQSNYLPHLESIQLSNLPLLEHLNCSYQKLTSLVLSDLPRLIDFELINMDIDLTLHNLPAVESLPIPNMNRITGLTVSELNAVSRFEVIYDDDLDLTHLDLIDMSGLSSINIDYIKTAEFTIQSLPVLDTLIWDNRSVLSALEIADLPMLSHAKLFILCNQHYPVSLSNLPSLKYLYVSGSNVDDLPLINLPSLSYIEMYNIGMVSFHPASLPSLNRLEISNANKFDLLNLTDLPNLQTLIFSHVQSPSVVTLGNLPALDSVSFNDLNVNSLGFSGLENLHDLSLKGLTHLQTLKFEDLPSLHNLYLYRNRMTSLTIKDMPSLSNLQLIENNEDNYNVKLDTVILNNLPNLSYLKFLDNILKNYSPMNVQHLPALYTFYYSQSNRLNISDLPSLYEMETQFCGVMNSSDGIFLDYLPNLSTLNLGGGWAYTSLDVQISDMPNLGSLSINFYADHIDLSGCPALSDLNISTFTTIPFLNLRNGNEVLNTFTSEHAITTICVDSDQEAALIKQLEPVLTNSNFTQSCQVIQNSTYNTIKGSLVFDYDLNGCQTTYTFPVNLKVNIVSGNMHYVAFTDELGEYSFITDILNDTITISPEWEEPDFNFSPESQKVVFTTYGNVFTGNFCAVPNGVRPDLEIILAPITPAVPGMEAEYSLVYRNKGNTALSGHISLIFEDDLIDFSTSSPAPASQYTDSLSWDFTDLLPFTSRGIMVKMNIHSPLEILPVNAGDDLQFSSTIYPVANDVEPMDNQSLLTQKVVSSFDPNDKICLEGPEITRSQTGEFLHYRIRFENTGNANAMNIILKDVIDTTKFDIQSLVPLSSSHACKYAISNNTILEIKFENIQLSYLSPDNTGYVLFKIRSREALQINDELVNSADIIFDFNQPVTTNAFTTTVIGNVGYPETIKANHDLLVFPNPVSDRLFFNTTTGIQKAELWDFRGNKVYEAICPTELNMRLYLPGMYILRIHTKNTVKCIKIIKL